MHRPRGSSEARLSVRRAGPARELVSYTMVLLSKGAAAKADVTAVVLEQLPEWMGWGLAYRPLVTLEIRGIL